MASWGLAFEYGKNAYSDMLKKQEELDRYLAEHDLWEMELRTKEATARAAQAEAERTSENSVILSQYADDILSGDYDAYANALSKVNPNKQFKHIGDGIIAEVDPSNPKLVLPGSARDISKIEPSKLVSELYKSAESTGAITAQERAAEEGRLKHNQAKELKKMEGDNAARVATINKQGTIAAATIKAGGGSSTTHPTGGRGSRINLSDKDREYLDSTVAQTLFGSGVSGRRTEEGGWEVYDKTGAPVQLKDEDIRDLEEVHRTLLTSTSNLAQSNSGDLQANIASAASLVSNQIKGNIDYNTAFTDYNKGLAAYNASVAANEANKDIIKAAEDKLSMWENTDMSSWSDTAIRGAEADIAKNKAILDKYAVGVKPTWNESLLGKLGDKPRSRTFGIGYRAAALTEKDKTEKSKTENTKTKK